MPDTGPVGQPLEIDEVWDDTYENTLRAYGVTPPYDERDRSWIRRKWMEYEHHKLLAPYVERLREDRLID